MRFPVRASPFPCSRLGVLAALILAAVWVVLVRLGPCLLRRFLAWVVFLCMGRCSGLCADMAPFPVCRVSKFGRFLLGLRFAFLASARGFF